jgi:hypothetical protein
MAVGMAMAAALPARARPAARPIAPAAAVWLALAERQVMALEFDRPVARVSVTDRDLLAVRSGGTRLEITANRGGRATVEVGFEDGATVVYEVTVAPARRPVAAPAVPASISLAVGEERELRSPAGVTHVAVEENGVARVRVDGERIAVSGVAPGETSIVLVDDAGTRTPVAVTVR